MSPAFAAPAWGSETKTQSTRAESARAFRSNGAGEPRETDREPEFGRVARRRQVDVGNRIIVAIANCNMAAHGDPWPTSVWRLKPRLIAESSWPKIIDHFEALTGVQKRQPDPAVEQ